MAWNSQHIRVREERLRHDGARIVYLHKERLERCIFELALATDSVRAASRKERHGEGERALLNLGHTFCHALESATGYSDRLLHGEGVAIGCALAFELSQRLGLCPQEAPSRVRAHLRALGMKTDLRDIPGDLPGVDGLLGLMAQDKKVVDGRLRFILARGIGAAFVADDVPSDVVRGVLADALAAR